MGAKVSGFANALYDSKKRQFLGRDGAGWGKLGVFYFFFYLGLAGFFCAMLAVFMALSPQDRPRYYSESSRMRTRSNPLAPGLGFRPQPVVDKNVIIVNKAAAPGEENIYVKNLDHFLQVYYPKENPVQKQSGDEFYKGGNGRKPTDTSKFNIKYPGECTSFNAYGFRSGRPCVLVKMNKVVGFKPESGSKDEEKDKYNKACNNTIRGIAVHCYGENYADEDNIGPIRYHSEYTTSDKCGSLALGRFPYSGKQNRQDVYQAPYVWVQFQNPAPNVLINVICRIYGKNIDFDKKTGRALTRFQLFVDTTSKQGSSGQADL